MCGIAGFLLPGVDPQAVSRLEAMCDVLSHRGPDGRGFFLTLPQSQRARLVERLGLEPEGTFPPSRPDSASLRSYLAAGAPASQLEASNIDMLRGPPSSGRSAAGRSRAAALTTRWRISPVSPAGLQVGLAARRLAIVDRARGHQPVCNERGSVVAVFNGEIYNYRALQQDLAARGHRLESGADTEVLPHLYESYGIDGMLDRMDGMFAFALWDKDRGTLYLARDRFGEKPLYYAQLPWGWVFASELKGLLVHQDVPRHLDLESVARYLFQEAVPAPHTIYRDIRKLEPGCCLEVRYPAMSMQQYWQLPSGAELENVWRANRGGNIKSGRPGLENVRRANHWDDVLLEQIRGAVASRLIGEVPIGVLLSGGLDSSLVAALTAKQVAGLHTFSIGFREDSFDESEHAEAVAKHLGTRHHAKQLTADELVPLMAALQPLQDEPLADGSLIPTFALCRWVREHDVGVVLSGDGGDEAFGGYPTYQAHRLDPIWDRLPGQLVALARSAGSALPASFANISRDFKVRRTLEGLRYRGAMRHAVWMAGLLPDEVWMVLTQEARAGLRTDLLEAEVLANAPDGYGWPESAQVQDIRGYLADDLLVKVDRASMAVGLEVRAPFLQHDLVTLGLALPPSEKVSLRDTKVALRRVCRRYLPLSIVGRPKKGFGMPTALWLKEIDQGQLEQWLTPPAGVPVLFERRVVQRWVAEHRAGSVDHRKRLWPLIMLEEWRKGPWGPG